MRRSLSWSGTPLGISTPIPTNASTPSSNQVKSNLHQTPNLSAWSPLPINFNNITAPNNVTETSGTDNHLKFLQNIISKQQSTIQLLAEHLNRLEVKLEAITAHHNTQSSSQHVSNTNPNLVNISGDSINNSILEKLNKAASTTSTAPLSNQNIVDIPDDSFTNGTKEDWRFDCSNTDRDWNFPIKYGKPKPVHTWHPTLSNSFENLSFVSACEDINQIRNEESPKSAHNKQAATMRNSGVKKRPIITTNEKHLNKYSPPKLAPGPFSYSEVANINHKPNSAANRMHKPTVTVFCDSIPKHVSAYHLSKETGTKASVKAFPGTNTRKLNLHMAIEIENNAPDIAIVHVGSNDLANRVPQKQILGNMKKIVQTLREAGTNYIFISGLVGRKDLKREIYDLNSELKAYCKSDGLMFIDNIRNIYFSKSHMAKDRIHLNYKGIDKLLDNFVDNVYDLVY